MSVESVGEDFVMGIEVFKHDICIRGATGCEYDNFCEGGQFLQELFAMRSHANSCLCNKKSTEMVVPPSTGKFSLTV